VSRGNGIASIRDKQAKIRGGFRKIRSTGCNRREKKEKELEIEQNIINC